MIILISTGEGLELWNSIGYCSKTGAVRGAVGIFMSVHATCAELKPGWTGTYSGILTAVWDPITASRRKTMKEYMVRRVEHGVWLLFLRYMTLMMIGSQMVVWEVSMVEPRCKLQWESNSCAAGTVSSSSEEIWTLSDVLFSTKIHHKRRKDIQITKKGRNPNENKNRSSNYSVCRWWFVSNIFPAWWSSICQSS